MQILATRFGNPDVLKAIPSEVRFPGKGEVGHLRRVFRRVIMPEVIDKQKATVLTGEQIEKMLQQIADGFAKQLRSPIMHTPAEVGLDFEEVNFPSLDGTTLEGWFIPAPGSNKIVICNHPMGFSRSGMPTQLNPWKNAWASSGNDFEVNLVPDYKILRDAGYNVLAYDLRNFGLSSDANGGIGSSGIFESRDVIGSLDYVRKREDTRDMTIGLFSRCLGCNSTLYAMKSRPNAFQGVRCLVGTQPVNTKTIVLKQLGFAGIPENRIEDLDQRIILKTSIGFDARYCLDWTKGVCVPTFLYQVHDDVLTVPRDMEIMFNNIPLNEKKLFWIEGTTRRWDGYAYFQHHPEQMLDWFATYMA